MAKIQDLSPELLIQIFKNSLDWTGDIPLRRRGPYILSQVCVNWRYILLSMTTELWTELHYNWRQEVLTDSEATDALIGSHVRRAGIRPLQLFLSLSPDEEPVGISNFFQEFSKRIHVLSLEASIGVFQVLTTDRDNKENFGTRFPGLYSLNLTVPYDDSTSSEMEQLETKDFNLSGCDRLKELSIQSSDSYFGFMTTELVSGVPWSQLTTLRIREDLALSLCPQLQECVLAVESWEELQPNFPSPVILPNLLKLQLEFRRDRHISSFFHAITLPRLYSLYISSLTGDLRVLQDALSSLQRRSCASIKELYLVDIEFTAFELPLFLQCTPQLKKLHLQPPIYEERYCIYSALFPRRQGSPAFEPVLAELESLVLGDNISNIFYFSRLLQDDASMLDPTMFDAVLSNLMNPAFKLLESGCMRKLKEISLLLIRVPVHCHEHVRQFGRDRRAAILKNFGTRVLIDATDSLRYPLHS
ncbi:hypothetical protein H0H92_011889 [Tricholoma furcatifolium]|nr:hypothetical protein H0H92_011889 [Tricholoma furcatifolium]